MKNVLKGILLILATAPLLHAQTLSTASYTQDNSVFLNPERGFYHHTQSHAAGIDENTTSSYSLLTSSELDSYKANGTSLILRLFYLHEFYNSTSVNSTYIGNMQTDFNLLRTKGMKAIIRFAYSDQESKKDLGATVSRIQTHLTSLQSVIEANQDVILAAQVGFVGTYGEWYYTTNFGDQGSISSSQWDMRSQVIQAYLNILPAGIQLQLRTPQQKAKYLQYIGKSTNAVTEQEAFNPSIEKSRLGHHNDCLLSSPDQLIQVFKIPKSSLSGLASTVKIGYRALKNGSLALSTTDSQLPSPSSDLASYAMGTYAVSNGTPNWSSIQNVVTFVNGTLQEFKAADDANYLYVRIRMSGYVRITKDKYQLFINTDNNTSTGWIDATAWSSSGANHMIENGVLKAHTLSGNGFTFNTVSTLQPDSTYGPSFDDQGTFLFESDIDQMAEDSRYVITGGETCAPTTQSECTASMARLALHHYTYLNEIYHPTVLSGWNTNGCYDDIQRNLGYRLRLTSAKIQSSVEVGKRLYVSLNVTNDGYSAPVKLRKLNLVMKNTSTNAVYTVPFQSAAADVRRWFSGPFTVNETLTIPADVPTGTYALSLALPDGASSLSANPAYAIRFANTSMWDATNGRNDLGINITVTSATSPSTPTITVDGSSSDWSNVDHVGLTGETTSIQKLQGYDDASNLFLLASGTLSSNYQLFIDADGKSSTGYQTSWVDGADYKIEAGKLYRHEWAETWVEILTFTSGQLVKNSSMLEISIPKSALYGIDEFVGLAYRDLNGSTIVGSLPASGNAVIYNLITPVTVGRPTVTITVNGNSADWAYINPVATSSGPIEVMKVYDSKENVYILLKGSLTTTASDYNVFFNTDNSAATGLVDDANWVGMGADYAIISGLFYKHDATTGAGVNGWAWTYQNLTVTTSLDGGATIQEIVIPKSKFNNMPVGTTMTIGYRKLSGNTTIAKLPMNGGMANYIIENPYIPNLQTLTIGDDITYLYVTVQGGSITTNYKVFLNTDNNTSTGYVDGQFWSTMGADYMIENGTFYQYNGVNQGWGWASAANTVQVTNTQINADLAERKIAIPRAEFPSLTINNVIQAGFVNDGAVDKLPLGNSLQSYTLTKAYIPALSNISLTDNSTNIFITVQGSVITTDYEAFLNTDNNTSTGFIDATWSSMGADYMIQNGTLYFYSGTNNGWGWTTALAGLQVNNTNINADLKQREIIIPRSKLSSLNVNNVIKGGYRSVVSGATSAAIPTGGAALLSHTIANTYVADLQSISVSDNSTSIIVTVTGGNLSSTYQVYLNSDNVAASGYSDGTWTSTGIDHLIENGNLYSYSGTNNSWNWSSISGNVSVSDNTSGGVTTRTITITKSVLSNLAGSIKAGYRNLVGGALSGKLPAGDNMVSFMLIPVAQNIGESGSLTFSQTNGDTWQTKTLTRSYNNPVVIISPLSYNGTEPATVRVKNVTATSFQYQIDEWDYLDGAHPSETVYYIVVEAGRYNLNGGVVMEAGIRSSNNKWATQTFNTAFTAPVVPLLLAQAITYNEATAVTTRIRYIDNTGFDLKVQEEESTDYTPHTRTSESVAYIAITEGSGNINYAFETDGTSRSYDNDFRKVWYNGTFSTPAIFAHMQTSYGGNTATLRYRSLASTNVSFMVEEEQSYDFEMEHTTEEIGYLVLGGTGVFVGTPLSSSGGRLATIDHPSNHEMEEDVASVSVYPNPVCGDQITIESKSEMKRVFVYNMSGLSIVDQRPMEKKTQISASSWSRGFYVISVEDVKGTITKLKVIR